MQKVYKTYQNVVMDGTQSYINGVTQCLDVIAKVPDGLKLLQGLCAGSHRVTIQHPVPDDDGNSCTRLTDHANPKLIQALEAKNQVNFQNELTAALDKAKRGGMTLEHFARQLTLGMSPVTYKGSVNVAPPKPISMPGSVNTPGAVMMKIGLEVADKMQILKDLASGARPLSKLPAGWDKDLPRLLRNYMTPGTGSGSSVEFNHTKTFHCVDDPAMHRRPPAIGLGHELIHALHNAKGVRMGILNSNNEKLEEIITTGFPPYNYEEISDNKLRTQWPSFLHLRENY